MSVLIIISSEALCLQHCGILGKWMRGEPSVLSQWCEQTHTQSFRMNSDAVASRWRNGRIIIFSSTDSAGVSEFFIVCGCLTCKPDLSTRLTEILEKPHTHSLTPFSCWAPLMCCKTLSISCSMRRAQCMILHNTHNKTVTQWKNTASAVSFMTEIRDLYQCSCIYYHAYHIHFYIDFQQNKKMQWYIQLHWHKSLVSDNLQYRVN